MTDPLRQEIAVHARTLIVKVGTRVLTDSDGRLDDVRITNLAEQLSAVKQTGRNVVLVSSGAVGAGMSELALPSRPQGLAQLQAVAAVGQTKLIEAYDRTLRKHQHHAAQVLLTAGDLDDRTRYLNVRNTLISLLEYGTIPVINENDTVAVEELQTTFGDNDQLAARVTNLLRAQLLVILSDVDGLYDGDPAAADSQVVATVNNIDGVLPLVRDQRTGISKGGMVSKLAAARIATAAGENVIIASGRDPRVLSKILAGEQVGTLLLAQGKSITPRKRWIGFSVQTRGRVLLDEGACSAITEHGRSLLAIGIIECHGGFSKGDAVCLCNRRGEEIARGLTNYSSAELDKIRGLRSDKIAQILGHCPYQEVVHRDNLALRSAPRSGG